MERGLVEVDRDPIPVQVAMRPLDRLGGLVAIDDPPPPAPRRRGRFDRLFVVTVVLPVAVAGAYLFLVAADRYRSEVSFVVRSTGGGAMVMAAGGGMGAASLSRAGEDAYIVDDYIVSRDALDRLVEDAALKDIVARPEADPVNRFPAFWQRPSGDRLFAYYRSMVKTWVDGATGISTIQVTAFRPADAQHLARILVGYAETVVNRINDRANADRVAYAAKLLDEARAGVAAAERRLTEFRSTSGTVDPSREYVAALQSIGRLSTEQSQREAALAQQVALTPNGPGIASLREKVKSFRDEIARQNRRVAGGEGSLAVKLASYDQLTLDRDIATKELVNAEINLETSRKEASQQRLYLQPVAEPNLPDLPEGPRRLLWFGIVAGTAGLLCAALRHLGRLAEDHAP